MGLAIVITSSGRYNVFAIFHGGRLHLLATFEILEKVRTNGKRIQCRYVFIDIIIISILLFVIERKLNLHNLFK